MWYWFVNRAEKVTANAQLLSNTYAHAYIGDNQSRRKKTDFKPAVLCLKFDFVSHPACSRVVL